MTTSRFDPRSIVPSFYANAVRTQLNLGWGPIDPQVVCAALHIQVFEEDLGISGNTAGALVLSSKGRLGILLNKNTRYASRKRFTVAHELGHACIKTHADPVKWCTADDINSYGSDRSVEREANEFAAELLLPGRTMRQRLKQSPPSMEMFSRLADEFGTSLTATACRLVAMAEFDRCAVALSSADRIRWVVTSPALRHSIDFMGKGDHLSASTAAAAVLRGEPAPVEPVQVPSTAWLLNGRRNPETILERVTSLPNFSQVLSFIELPPSEDEIE